MNVTRDANTSERIQRRCIATDIIKAANKPFADRSRSYSVLKEKTDEMHHLTVAGA
jgi:hypothetical protein